MKIKYEYILSIVDNNNNNYTRTIWAIRKIMVNLSAYYPHGGISRYLLFDEDSQVYMIDNVQIELGDKKTDIANLEERIQENLKKIEIKF